MSARRTGTFTMSNDYIITTSDFTQEPTESVGSAVFTHMKIHRVKIAQIDAKTGQTDTFGELLQRCIRTALHMSDKNITREHIISMCTYNHMNSAVPYISTQFLGAKIAPLGPCLSAQEMTHHLNLVRPKMIFTATESVRTLEKVIQDISLNCEIVVFGESNKHTEFCEFLKPHRNEEQFEPAKINNPKDVGFIHFTSGSTGLPKGICLSHHYFLGEVMKIEILANPNYYVQSASKKITHPPTLLMFVSLYWELSATMLINSIIKGFCRLVCEDFEGKEIWNLIQKYGPTVLSFAPAFIPEILANRKKEVDVENVLCVLFWGSRIFKQDLLKFREIFPQAYVALPYGQTEAGLIVSFNPDDATHRKMHLEKVESNGLPMKGISYKVVDIESNKSLGPGQRGELRIKPKFLMNGYYKQDSSETFDKDGWLKTGDIAYYDEDYCFYIVDRIKEAFLYHGWSISPAFLEDELLNHPAVKQAVVIGIPKGADDHLPMGLVVVKEGYQISEEEIEKFVEDRVPDRQRLRAGVKFIESVPLTPTGKLKRRVLRDMVLDGKL